MIALTDAQNKLSENPHYQVYIKEEQGVYCGISKERLKGCIAQRFEASILGLVCGEFGLVFKIIDRKDLKKEEVTNYISRFGKLTEQWGLNPQKLQETLNTIFESKRPDLFKP